MSNISVTISTHFNSIWSLFWTLSGATTPGQSGPWRDDNERSFHISQSSVITATSASNCLEYCLAWVGLTVLQRNSRCILQPQPTGQHWIRWISLMDLVKGSTVYSCIFTGKSIFIVYLLSLNTVMTFINGYTQKFFFAGESKYFHSIVFYFNWLFVAKSCLAHL